jgi:hypothetical protein
MKVEVGAVVDLPDDFTASHAVILPRSLSLVECEPIRTCGGLYMGKLVRDDHFRRVLLPAASWDRLILGGL